MSDLVCVDGLCLDLDKVSHILNETIGSPFPTSMKNMFNIYISWKEDGQVHHKYYNNGFEDYDENDYSEDNTEKGFIANKANKKRMDKAFFEIQEHINQNKKSSLVCVDGLCLDINKVTHIQSEEEQLKILKVCINPYKISWKSDSEVYYKYYDTKESRDKAFLEIQQAIKDRKDK